VHSCPFHGVADYRYDSVHYADDYAWVNLPKPLREFGQSAIPRGSPLRSRQVIDWGMA